MPKKARALTALEVDRLGGPMGGSDRLVPVGGVAGLRVRIKPSGARSWVLRVLVGGKRRDIGLGGAPEVSLAEARRKAKELRAEIARGANPVVARAEARAALVAARAEQECQRFTFRQAFDAFMQTKAAELGSERRARNWSSGIRTHALSVIGEKPVAELTRDDVLAVLRPIWTTNTVTATRVRQRFEAVLQAAIVAEHRGEPNPARWAGNLDAMLPKPGAVSKVVHQPALTLADAPDWFAALRARSGASARELEFVALTAARSGEVRGMTWQEIDTKARTWTIAADRMKAGKPHRVPLSDAILALIEAQPRDGSIYVFPAARGGQLSDVALSAVMRKIAAAAPGRFVDEHSKRPAVPHGLRSTFRDWCAVQGVDRDLAEIALARDVGSAVERAYRRSDMVERRRDVMARWGVFLSQASR